MRLFLLSGFFLFKGLWMSAQSAFWSNHGALVSIKDGAYLSVLGDCYNDNLGHYNNSDTIFLTGDWIHNANNRCFDSIDRGWVYLYAADQRIRGSRETHFYNLILKTAGVKYADIHTWIDGFLDLTDREFNLDTNTAHVTNMKLDAVRRTTGFVSSLEDGGLNRKTDTTGIYLYPLGSNMGTPRYRPIEMTPHASNINWFKARFANFDPTSEGFDRDQRFHLLCQVEPDWYHRLYHPYGSDSVDIAIFYDTLADGNQWNTIAHWQQVPEWQSIGKDTIVYGSPFARINRSYYNDFSYSPFALGLEVPPFAIAGVDTIMWRGDTIQLNASGGVAYVWTPPFNLSCADCPDPYAWPDTNIIYYLTVENGIGCEDYDSLRMFIRDKPISDLFIPNAITPNGDGFNDFWYIRDLERYPDHDVRIINRWGDQILFEKPYSQTWTGTYNGEPLPGATYYYIIHVRSNGKDTEFNGPLTVVR